MTAAVVLAGGLGTRLRSAVPDLPKPMAPVAGRPFLEHLLDYWLDQGISRFILSVGYRHEAISDHFGAAYRGAALEYVVEETPLGTGGGAVLAAQRLEGVPFVLLNGDTFFAVELNVLEAFAKACRADWCFSLFRTSESGRYMGLEVSEDGRVTGLRSGAGTPGRLANGGVYWVDGGALAGRAAVTQSLEDDIFPQASAAGQRLYGREFSGAFIDIGVPADYYRAASLFT